MQTIDFSLVTFNNDFFEYSLEDGGILRMDRLDEDFKSDETGTELVLDTFNIEIVTLDEDENETVTPLSAIIGLEYNGYKIQTDYPEYEGKVLTSENFAYCYMEVGSE